MAVKRAGLGRGLDSLIPNKSKSAAYINIEETASKAKKQAEKKTSKTSKNAKGKNSVKQKPSSSAKKAVENVSKPEKNNEIPEKKPVKEVFFNAEKDSAEEILKMPETELKDSSSDEGSEKTIREFIEENTENTEKTSEKAGKESEGNAIEADVIAERESIEETGEKVSEIEKKKLTILRRKRIT